MITRIAHAASTMHAMSTMSAPTAFGNKLDPFDPSLTPGERAEAGWLGQVPPPSMPAPSNCQPPATEPTYANPQLAPDPWLNPGIPGMNTDPTLFG